MALPSSASIENLTGKYSLNKTLSDDPDPILATQGLAWLKRKAISFAPVVLHVSQKVDESGVGYISVKSMVGGKEMASEERFLDFKPREVDIPDFGTLRVRSEWLSDLSTVEDEFLRKGWKDGDKVVHIITEALTGGWVLEHIWGVQEFDGGVRRYVRHVCIKKAGEEKRAKLVYDWVE